MKRKYIIEVLSPLHIGNGNKISPMEYILDDQFHRIDMDSLFKDERFPVDEFIQSVKEFFYLGNFYPDIARQHKKYSLEISQELKKEKKIKEVYEFIKSGGRVYIPGSSIKGAIRTAILYYAIKNDREIFDFVKDHLLKLSIKGGDRRKADDKIEEKFFGRTTHDFMKGLIITDSNLLPPSCLKLQLVRVLSVNVANKLTPKLGLLAETVKLGNKFEISIKIDDFYFEAEELGFKNKKEFVDNLPQILMEYSKDLIDYEIKFFEKYGLEEIVTFYEDLRPDDDILLRISWGSGWHTMSIARIFHEEPFFWELRKKFNLGRKGVKIFPKSRKIVFDDKLYPLGWIKLGEIK